MHGCHGMLMAENTPVGLLLSPTSVTVHDDGHMLWHAGFVDIFEFHINKKLFPVLNNSHL
jgi:hypothetical protein